MKTTTHSILTHFILTILFLMTTNACNCGETSSKRDNHQQITKSQKDTCDDPDANINCCFINMPEKLNNTMNIDIQKETADKLVISGTIFKADDITPYPGIILYAFHTDSKGYYSKNGNEAGVQKWHGRLHGWCITDKNGYYEIHTIRPARYPDNSMPAHIHAAIKTDTGQMFWITDYVFKDDSLVDEKYLSSLTNIGGTGVVDIKKNSENIWTGKRDIILEN